MQIISKKTLEAVQTYNETALRFHIVDPILRLLGYPDSDSDNVYLEFEEKLEYPYYQIGHRSKRDVPLGFPDYRAGLKGARGSFVIEAKAGSAPIQKREIEQAHSYAAHAQVGANYFLLCNGSMIVVYETLSGSSADPIAKIPLIELNERFHELENILSPVNLEKNCKIKHDTKLKLAHGLTSSVKIRSGSYSMLDYEYRIIMNGQDCTALIRQSVPQIAILDQQLELLKTSFDLRVSNGIAERGVDGRIHAHVEFSGATTHNHQAMAIIGISEINFVTADEFISTNVDSPSIFESLKDFRVSRGTLIPQMFGGASEMTGDLSGEMFIKAAMFYTDGKIKGQYISLSKQEILIPNAAPLKLEMDFSGSFELELIDS